jgi:hypothetical protein
MQRINLVAALAVVLRAHPMGQAKQGGEALLECLVAGDLAADAADHRAQPSAQKFELTPGMNWCGGGPPARCSNSPIALAVKRCFAAMKPRAIRMIIGCDVGHDRASRFVR